MNSVKADMHPSQGEKQYKAWRGWYQISANNVPILKIFDEQIHAKTLTTCRSLDACFLTLL